MTRLRRRLLVLCCLPVLAGCASSSPAASTSTTESVTPTVAASSAASVPEISLGVPSASPTGSSTAPAETSGATDVRHATDAAAFAMPSGNIVCVMAADGVRCDFIGESKAWTVPQPTGCQLAWGDSLALGSTVTASCHGDTVATVPELGSDYVTWWHSGDPTVSLDTVTLAALPYGSAIVVGPMRCESATTGVRCLNTGTRHGFTMAREAYTIF